MNLRYNNSMRTSVWGGGVFYTNNIINVHFHIDLINKLTNISTF